MEARRPRFLPYVAALMTANVRAATAYRVSFLGQVVFMMLNNAIFLVFWWIFFDRFGRLGDWRLGDMLLLFGLGAFSFGLASTFLGNCTRLPGLVVNGELDTVLSLPRDPLLHLLMRRMSVPAVGDVVFGFLLVALFSPLPATRLPLFVILGAAGAVIFASFAVVAGSLTFFAGSSERTGRLLHEALLSFSLYPDSIFGARVNALFYTALPAAFMTHLPARLLRDLTPAGVAAMAGAALLWALTARAAFRAGLRRYESGNLVLPSS
jgi:ABC-2 type transport system permease protein